MKSERISGAGYREIAQVLRESIQSGELPPGAPLPPESEVSRRWSVSRVTARRALSVLESEGLVETITGRGRFVRGLRPGQLRSGGRAESIAAELGAAIRSGELAAGARIDSEAALSQRYGVARGTAREVLLILEREGLTVTVHGRGRFVAVGKGFRQKKSRADEIAEALEASILAGELQDGSTLPGELSLAEQFGAARSTIRRALGILEDKGLVAKRSGKARVVVGSAAHDGGVPE